jgi:hypothetical protein
VTVCHRPPRSSFSTATSSLSSLSSMTSVVVGQHADEAELKS